MAVVIIAPSCKREIEAPPAQDHEKSPYRILAIGKAPGDTSTSTTMWARTETVGLVVAEDSKLRAELIGYQKVNGQGVYTVALTNKQDCKANPIWGWDGLRITSITPSGAHDEIPANGYRVYTLTGDAKVGKIKVKTECDCGNSSTLLINISLDILPITYLSNTAVYDLHTGKTTINFEIDNPATINWFIIQKMRADNVWVQVAMVPGDDQTKKYSIRL